MKRTTLAVVDLGSNATRLQIASVDSRGRTTVLAEEPEPGRRAGLVRVRKQGREMYYRLNKDRIVGTLQGLLDSLTCC